MNDAPVVLAVADHLDGRLRDVSRELVTAGRTIDGTVHVAVVGEAATDMASGLALEGVTRVHAVDYGAEFDHGVYVQALEQLVEAVDPDVLLVPNTVNGLDYAPGLAARIDAKLLTDAVDLVRRDGTFRATRELYGGKLEADVDLEGSPVALTLRPGEWDPTEMPGDADVVAFDAAIDEADLGTTHVAFEEASGGDVDIADADVLVSVGRGIGEEENLELIFELAEALDATVSASRPIVDSGWLPKNRQVGQSGKTVTPEIYIAIGISGAVQHVAGMKSAETIVAINTDPDAPIFEVADYGVVDDLFDVVPALVEEFS